MTKPKFTVYNVTSRKAGDDYWNCIGGAFEFTTQDGRAGIRIPDLNLVLVEPKDEPAGEQPPYDPSTDEIPH